MALRQFRPSHGNAERDLTGLTRLTGFLTNISEAHLVLQEKLGIKGG